MTITAQSWKCKTCGTKYPLTTTHQRVLAKVLIARKHPGKSCAP